MPTIIRPALHSEDNILSHILHNAFLPVWNHNWFQGVTTPLPPVPTTQSEIRSYQFSSLQKARIRFYLSLIKATRLLGGEVLVNVLEPAGTIPSDAPITSTPDIRYGASLLWLPPHTRLSIAYLRILYSSGFLRTISDYGLQGTYRVNFIFEANIEVMLRDAGVAEAEHSLVWNLAANPEFKGNGYASELLRWKIEQLQDRGGVVLDTTTMQGVRAYERMGFQVLGEREVQTGCDEVGVQSKKGVDWDGKHVQRVMVLNVGEYVTIA